MATPIPKRDLIMAAYTEEYDGGPIQTKQRTYSDVELHNDDKMKHICITTVEKGGSLITCLWY